ncbi:MAG TPA: sigma-70 family RNA polymerase sigma factor [Chthoniobacterales bacterium]|nr:sigma-70 family RNA polymerase sigma factor [Chthoniobacterales bacterium]
MNTDPDAVLMLRLKNGEDAVLNTLMTRWQQPLVTFIYRYIGHESDALDLAQEAFVHVYQTRHRYRVQAKFSTWLFAIAGNLCRNYLRRRQHRGESIPEPWDTEDAELAELLRSPDDSPDQAITRSESSAIVKEAIGKLPQNLKLVILLYEYEGLSYEEVSSILRCSVKAVEMKLYRARKLLREGLLRSDVR